MTLIVGQPNDTTPFLKCWAPFGDYFKEEAIVYAFAFLSKRWRLTQAALRHVLSATPKRVFARVTGFGDDKLLPITTADNFWSMGPARVALHRDFL